MLTGIGGHAGPDLAVRGDVADFEVRVPLGLAFENDLVMAAGLKPRDLQTGVLLLPGEEGAVIGDTRIVERGRIVVAGPATIEHHLDWNVFSHLRDTGKLVAAA